MKYIKVARLAAAWATGAQRLRYPPKDVSIEPTNLCNYRCAYCPQSDPAHREQPSGFMKLEHLDQILGKIQAAGAAWHKVINYTHDGEPFLHPEFPEFVRRASKRGFRVRFSSNGSRLTPERLKSLTDTGARFRARVDFSGSREAFETYRSRKGDWETVRDHIAHLIEVSNANPAVRVEVHEMSGYGHPEDAEVNLQRLKAMLPQPTSRRVRFTVCNFHNATGLVQLNTPRAKPAKPRRCPYPWVSLNIAWNGDIHACPRDLRGQTRLGNILEAPSLAAIWNGPLYQTFRRQHAEGDVANIGACRGCDLPWREDRQRWSAQQILYRLRDI